jgi:hypothetical protein
MKARPESRRPGNATGCGIRPRKRLDGGQMPREDSYSKFVNSAEDLSDVELSVYKRVFLSEDGQFVLANILEKCKFMENCENERDMALNNFAKDLIATVYWDREKRGINIYRILDFIKHKFRR